MVICGALDKAFPTHTSVTTRESPSGRLEHTWTFTEGHRSVQVAHPLVPLGPIPIYMMYMTSQKLTSKSSPWSHGGAGTGDGRDARARAPQADTLCDFGRGGCLRGDNGYTTQSIIKTMHITRTQPLHKSTSCPLCLWPLCLVPGNGWVVLWAAPKGGAHTRSESAIGIR